MTDKLVCSMTPRTALTVLNWSIGDLARATGAHPRSARRWIEQPASMPAPLLAWLLCMADEWDAVRRRFSVPEK